MDLSKPVKPATFVLDDMLFTPYLKDGWIATVKTNKGNITVRYGGSNLLTTGKRPYEIRLQGGEVVGYQTAEDILKRFKNV